MSLPPLRWIPLQQMSLLLAYPFRASISSYERNFVVTVLLIRGRNTLPFVPEEEVTSSSEPEEVGSSPTTVAHASYNCAYSQLCEVEDRIAIVGVHRCAAAVRRQRRRILKFEW